MMRCLWAMRPNMTAALAMAGYGCQPVRRAVAARDGAMGTPMGIASLRSQ